MGPCSENSPKNFEFRLIQKLAESAQAFNEKGLTAIGDDCAVLPLGGQQLLLKVDALQEGSHFQFENSLAPAYATIKQVAEKAVRSALSDIAAMGGCPQYMLASLSLPRSMAEEDATNFALELQKSAEEFSTLLVGGETNRWDGPLTLSISLLGSMQGHSPVLRSGAKAGNLIYVTGALGGSLSARHLKPQPRIKEGQWLANFGATSMIDVSDGLSGDLLHCCEQSELSALLDEERLPIHPDVLKLKSQKSPTWHALNDGEDFELLFSIPAELKEALESSWPFKIKLTNIGHFEKQDDLPHRLQWETAAGPIEILVESYQH